MIQEYVCFWQKIFDFKVKSSRREYWLEVLANFLIYLYFFYLQVIPNLSIQIKRARDAGKKLVCYPNKFNSICRFNILDLYINFAYL